jgi:hypothetical protein
VKLISDSILVGFKAGAGLTIAMTQLPSLLGVAGGGHNFIDGSSLLLGQLDQTHYVVLLVGVFAMGLLVLGEQLLPGNPSRSGLSRSRSLLPPYWGFPSRSVYRRRGNLPTWQGRPSGYATCQPCSSDGMVTRWPAACRNQPCENVLKDNALSDETVGTMALKPIVDSTGYIVNRQSEIIGAGFPNRLHFKPLRKRANGLCRQGDIHACQHQRRFGWQAECPR